VEILPEKTKIMGILNVTPDSFYDGGKYFSIEGAVRRAYEIRDEGADIIDVGGESTRPGSKPVDAAEEAGRVIPVIERISSDIGIPISVDTSKRDVAEQALKAGAEIINDISGLTFDEGLADLAAEYGAKIVLAHIKGRPENMQENPVYGDLIGEITSFLGDAASRAVRAGVKKENIIVDPGIGFGKTLEDNYRIISGIKTIKRLGYPVLIGLSRKSLIGKLYSVDSDRLPATIALNAVSIFEGADIIRVHDVSEHMLALAGLEMLKRVS
jgi:dihydropteroate synthase